MLGSIDRSRVQQLFEALLQQDAAAILGHISDLAAYSPDYSAVLEALISLLHRVAVFQVVPDVSYGDAGETEKVAAYAQQLCAEDLQLYYQIALIGRRDLPLNPDPKAGLEMVLLRMLAFIPTDGVSSESAKKKLSTNPKPVSQRSQSNSVQSNSVQSKPIASKAQEVAQPKQQGNNAQVFAVAGNQAQCEAQPVARTKLDLVVDNEAVECVEPETSALASDLSANPTSPNAQGDYLAVEPENFLREAEKRLVDSAVVQKTNELGVGSNSSINTPSGAVLPRLPLTALVSNDVWIKVAHSARLKGMTRNILMQCGFISVHEGTLSLLIDPQYIDLLNASHQSRIEQALAETLDAPVKVQIKAGTVEVESPAAWEQRISAERLQAARASLEADENVQYWMAEFDATFEIDSIKPLDN